MKENVLEHDIIDFVLTIIMKKIDYNIKDGVDNDKDGDDNDDKIVMKMIMIKVVSLASKSISNNCIVIASSGNSNYYNRNSYSDNKN